MLNLFKCSLVVFGVVVVAFVVEVEVIIGFVVEVTLDALKFKKSINKIFLNIINQERNLSKLVFYNVKSKNRDILQKLLL
jgi:hypothetical protein